MRDLNGKVAFVTGGAGGIGLSMGKAFGREGMSVMLADIDAVALEEAVSTLRKHQIRAEGMVVDTSSRASVEAGAEATMRAFGKVHVVCNNAGVASHGMVGEVPPNDWNWVMDVNFMGVVYGVETFQPLVAAHGEGGHFVNTASMAGMVSPARMEPYSSSKFAVVALSEGWAQQLAPQNIGMSVLCPGYVKTRIDDSRRNRQASYGADERPPLALFESSPVQSGISPDIVGARVIEGIKANELYIFTHPDFKSLVEDRFKRILESFDRAKESPALASVPRAVAA